MEELSSLKSRWDEFEIMMESHQLMIKDQVRSHLPLSLSLCVCVCVCVCVFFVLDSSTLAKTDI